MVLTLDSEGLGFTVYGWVLAFKDLGSFPISRSPKP